jgi:hypothetical protein
MRRSWLLLSLVVVVVGCSKKKQEDTKRDPEKVAATKKSDDGPPPPGPKKIDGPSVSPVKSESVAFVVPKADTKWWGEMNFSCYRAAMSLTGTRTAGEAFEKLSPNVIPAMQKADIDLGRDMAAMGAFDCGGSPCLYVAATLTKPEKMPDVLSTLLPTSNPKQVSPGHYTLETAGMTGTRTIHVRVIPIQWSAAPSGDAWNTEAGRATHVVFIGGVDGKNADIDPLTVLADAQSAPDVVKDAEAVLADAHGRCILGRVAANDFQPGFKLDRARFALAAPPGNGDALMKLLDSNRTMEMTVELFLSPAPKDKDVKKWIAQGKSYLGNIATPLKMQFAGNPMLDVYFDMLSLLGERGFKYELKDKSLRFTWRTDRVPASDLQALEARFQALGGTAP